MTLNTKTEGTFNIKLTLESTKWIISCYSSLLPFSSFLFPPLDRKSKGEGRLFFWYNFCHLSPFICKGLNYGEEIRLKLLLGFINYWKSRQLLESFVTYLESLVRYLLESRVIYWRTSLPTGKPRYLLENLFAYFKASLLTGKPRYLLESGITYWKASLATLPHAASPLDKSSA